jgi:hypothetical protein
MTPGLSPHERSDALPHEAIESLPEASECLLEAIESLHEGAAGLPCEAPETLLHSLSTSESLGRTMIAGVSRNTHGSDDVRVCAAITPLPYFSPVVDLCDTLCGGVYSSSIAARSSGADGARLCVGVAQGVSGAMGPRPSSWSNSGLKLGEGMCAKPTRKSTCRGMLGGATLGGGAAEVVNIAAAWPPLTRFVRSKSLTRGRTRPPPMRTRLGGHGDSCTPLGVPGVDTMSNATATSSESLPSAGDRRIEGVGTGARLESACEGRGGQVKPDEALPRSLSSSSSDSSMSPSMRLCKSAPSLAPELSVEV